MREELYLKYDLYRYFYPSDEISRISLAKKIKIILLTQGIWALVIYRSGSWVLRKRKKLGLLTKVMLPVLTFLQKIVEITTGIDIPFTATIGRGLYIGHFGQIILSGKTVMGVCCNLSQGVTIGQAGRGEQKVPQIGDRVYLGPGAKIFGEITIGNDVAIGANAVVTKSLSDNSVAVGIPAKTINLNSSRNFVCFNSERMRN